MVIRKGRFFLHIDFLLQEYVLRMCNGGQFECKECNFCLRRSGRGDQDQVAEVDQDLTNVQLWFQRLYDSDLDVPALLGKKSKEPCTFRFPALWRVPPAFPRVPFQALHLKCLNDSLRAGYNSSFTDRLKTEMIHSD